VPAGRPIVIDGLAFGVLEDEAKGQIQRSLQMLKELTWFDIPIVYENGTRAILAIEKGAPGERAFQEAFTAWSAAPANPARQ